MSFSLQQIPAQNWDCHVSGSCCKEYRVILTEEEMKRIEDQNWDIENELGGLSPFMKMGLFRKRHFLNHREDGSCVFLGEEGRCRIHEKFGYETKPLPCRLFPYVLIPVHDHWRVSVRFACPSAAADRGRAIQEQEGDLLEFAQELAEREGMKPRPDGSLMRPPVFQSGEGRRTWPDVLTVVQSLLTLLTKPEGRVEQRLRKCLALSRECQNAKLANLDSEQFQDLIKILEGSVSASPPPDLNSMEKPGWVGRVLFRQALALFLRKDHGPKKGIARHGRWALLKAAWRFVKGTGKVPRLHDWLPEVDFEKLEEPIGPLPAAAESILQRYYLVKVSALQFCGAAYFGMPVWEGLDQLAMTYPVLMWVTRAFVQTGHTAEEGVTKALSIVDDHIGFNKMLKRFRQRLSFRILSGRGEIERLIAWYSR